MGKVSKSLKVRQAARKSKRTYTVHLEPLAVLEHGDSSSRPNSCTDNAKKWVAVSDLNDNDHQIIGERRENDEHLSLCSPLRFSNGVSLLDRRSKTPIAPCRERSFYCSTRVQVNNLIRTPTTPCALGRLSSSQSVLSSLIRTPMTPCTKISFRNSPYARINLLTTPKTPCYQEMPCQSRLECLPIDMLVKVLCHLHHDQLKPAFHVSKRIREAVILARQCHFNFTTPDRSRQALLNSTTPQPWEQWPFVKQRSHMLLSPKTPKPTRYVSWLLPKIESGEICQIPDALFQESAFPSTCASSSSFHRSTSRSQMASNRVLFCNDEEVNCCNF